MKFVNTMTIVNNYIDHCRYHCLPSTFTGLLNIFHNEGAMLCFMMYSISQGYDEQALSDWMNTTADGNYQDFKQELLACWKQLHCTK